MTTGSISVLFGRSGTLSVGILIHRFSFFHPFRSDRQADMCTREVVDRSRVYRRFVLSISSSLCCLRISPDGFGPIGRRPRVSECFGITSDLQSCIWRQMLAVNKWLYSYNISEDIYFGRAFETGT